MIFILLDYAVDLSASIILLLSAYRYQSWFLWGLGLIAFLATVLAKNVAAWRNNKSDVKSENT